MRPRLQQIHNVINDMPGIHGTGTYRISDSDLAILDSHVHPESVTAETGSGLSTIMFAIIGSQHTAIAPAPEEWLRIQDACQRHQIPVDRITFRAESSVDVLPTLPVDAFDFCFIDGCHGFPVAQLDFFYMSRLLKVGGVLAVDDIQIWSCGIINDFLKHEEGWEHLATGEKTSFFRKTRADQEAREWDHQPYNIQRTNAILRKTAIPDAMHLYSLRFKKLMQLVKKGDFATIRGKLQGS